MFSSNKLSDQFVITQNKLGSGAFGSVYIAKLNNKDIAVKCENKSNQNLTLIREFKICRKVYMVKKYLKYLYLQQEIKNELNIINLKNNPDNQNPNNPNNQTNPSNLNDEIKNIIEEKNKELDKLNKNIETYNKNNIIKIHNHLVLNNLLTIPDELGINFLIKSRCIPETFSYIECNDFNFLTMELCGDNFENITDKFNLTERAKFFTAHHLLHIMSCIHRCGVIHRDIKLSNIVFNKKISSVSPDSYKKLLPVIIDMGLAKEYYKYEGERVIMIPPHATKSITGTLRYISLNIHEFKSPTIVDDLISLTYALIVIFTGKNLPWIGHKKDAEKFDISKHTFNNCKCGYHKNKANNDTKTKNTIAEVKFHTPLEELVGPKYKFFVKWLKYLYSLKPKQLPSYNQLYKMLHDESKQFDKLYIELEPKN
jgi:serine/threonine protein kinase